MLNSIEKIFGEKGRLSEVYPDFEFRKGQLEMAKVISHAIKEKKNLLVEAGTGVGKTLGYLIPAIESLNNFIISTGTKNLQDQIFLKEIPFTKRQLGYDFTSCYVKGRENYLCLRRFKEFEAQPLFEELREITFYGRVKRWVSKTETGDRGEIADVPEYLSFWRDINARSDTCIGKKCSYYSQCFLTLLRNKAQRSQLVIVNHHLFFADLSIRNDFGAVIPPYKYLIFDEAHMIEEIATQYFGVFVSRKRFDDIMRDAGRLLPLRKVGDAQKGVSQALKESLDAFFSLFKGVDGRYRLTELAIEDLFQNVDRISNQMDLLQTLLKKEVVDSDRLENISRRGIELIDSLRFLIKQKEKQFAYFYEVKGQNIILQACPIDLSKILREHLFTKVNCAILTSATLTVEKKFSFLQDRLGIVHQIEFIAESPFDLRKQAILYLPSQMPEPQDEDFLISMQRDLLKLIDISKGRAFILFTSLAHMKKLYEMMAKKAPYPLFIQGELAKPILLEKFKKSQGAILFATSSFWQGVDVQGETLSLVVIDKLPFDVPTDPLISARIEYLKEEGRNPFYSYQLPLAVIELKQGLGRLIRSTKDKGILALFDSRILKRRYGDVILKSLPSFRITDSLEETEEFFKNS